MKAEDFKPELMQDVKTYFFGVAVYSCNPNLCATKECGEQLAELFIQYNPIVTMQVPQWGTWKGRFGQTQEVAWLQFPNGAVVNCGTLADWWNRVDPANAYRNAELEVRGVIADKWTSTDNGAGR